jgi:sodium/potassium-transporting ATPase subunit alpha
MKIHQLSVAAALDSLGTSVNGLSVAEALRRLREYGPNQIERIARTPVVLRLLREFVQFFSVICWIAAGLASVAEWSAPGQGMARIGFALIGVILVSGLLSFWQEPSCRAHPQRADETAAATGEPAARQRGGPGAGRARRCRVARDQGDVTPADCRLIEGFRPEGEQ